MNTIRQSVSAVIAAVLLCSAARASVNYTNTSSALETIVIVALNDWSEVTQEEIWVEETFVKETHTWMWDLYTSSWLDCGIDTESGAYGGNTSNESESFGTTEQYYEVDVDPNQTVIANDFSTSVTSDPTQTFVQNSDYTITYNTNDLWHEEIQLWQWFTTQVTSTKTRNDNVTFNML
jgi:hypothetical protein